MSFSMRSRYNAMRSQPDLSVLSSEVPMTKPILATVSSTYSASIYPDLSTYASAPPINYYGSHVLVCYLPTQNTTEGIVSCTQEKGGDKIVFTMDHRSAIIPAGAIIDSIEFFGFNGFETKDVFSIGLGQLNTDITFPLIQDADSKIANERVGGCRDFFSFERDGKNNRNIVICDSNVNVDLSTPVTSGELQIVIRYHMKYL